jgi:ribonuclease HI
VSDSDGHITVYTDGSALGNPGPGGYGALLIYKGKRKELSGGFRLTTNNRMEILAIVECLDVLKRPCKVTVWSDSQYVVNTMSKGWIHSWQKKNWIKSDKKPVKNIDLWKRMLEVAQPHDVTYQWLRGHTGHEENERCDVLAKEAANGTNLPADKGYEASMD